MMSKKQLACMLTLHIIYLLLGASIFYHIESPLEMTQRSEEKLERLEIQNLLYENYIPNDPDKQDSILKKLSEYCGKPMYNSTTEDEETPTKWDFYHSFFFSYTVVSTIGYGNLAPTTHLSRILMIFYGLFGIPINGILLANLGEYFGLQLIKTYRKYKRKSERRADRLDYVFHRCGMFGQIMLYLVPGFLFFIFLPACIFAVFEGWDYVAAVYYAFVTLTTIGFGDLVAGTVDNGFGGYFVVYQIFLIVWITFGLGYIVMLLGFITSGMRSKGVHKFEQKMASQLKIAQNRLLQGFSRDIAVIRKIINEANIIKLKPVYVEPTKLAVRSSSCPILTFDVEPRCPITKRKRANSENIALSVREMLRIQSDTDLLGIDKEKTFTASAIVKPAELLARVVNILGGLDDPPMPDRGVHMFADDEILRSEKPPIDWSIGHEQIIKSSQQNQRIRAFSVDVPNHHKNSLSKQDHDFTWTNGDTAEKYRQAANYRRLGKLSLPNSSTPPTEQHIIHDHSNFKHIISKLNPFKKHSTGNYPGEYIQKTYSGRDSTTQTIPEEENTKAQRRGSLFPNFLKQENKELDSYKEKTKRGRHSIFPTFDFNEDEDVEPKVYKERTNRGRHSIFPTFDFAEDADAAAAKVYHEKTKHGRHSIFPTFDFNDDDNSDAARYKEKTRKGRHSIFPTFDFSEDDDNFAKAYKEKTKRGRHSIFPTFDFRENNSNDEDSLNEKEIQDYHKRTKKGRGSLFPSFGRDKNVNDDDSMPEDMSEELKRYQNKTKRGRTSLFPSFSSNKKKDQDIEHDLPDDVKQYQNQTKRGRNSLFAGDIENYRKNMDDKHKDDAERKTNKSKRRPSIFDPDVNIEELPEEQQVEVLEQTSVADLLRALAVLESASPSAQRKHLVPEPTILETIEASKPGSAGSKRRNSGRPDFALAMRQTDNTDDTPGSRRRRLSVRAPTPLFTPTLATVVAGAELQTTATAARERRMSMLANPPPPPYSEAREDSELQQPKSRRFSPAPGGPGLKSGTGPVPRMFSHLRKESVASVEEEGSRRGSLTDVVIDKNKDKT